MTTTDILATVSTVSGATGTAAAFSTGDTILSYVTLGITIATTVLNFVLMVRERWVKQTKELRKELSEDEIKKIKENDGE